MNYKQIGNGGAFNFDQCNSSFIIENNNKLLLFDCGWSVFSELKNRELNKEFSLKDLEYIYISHMDDDHMGSLKTLLYYQYFVNGLTSKIICNIDIFNDLLNYIGKDFNRIKDNGKFIPSPTPIVEYFTIESNQVLNLDNKLKLSTILCDHHKSCFGLIVEDINNNKKLGISGDTIAIKDIEISLINCDVIFHDFSNWDAPLKQIHACKSNIEEIYSKNFISKLNFYHTGLAFDSSWVNL